MAGTHLRIHQAAVTLGVHPRTIRRWIARGRLPFVQLPHGERRIPAEAMTLVVRTTRCADLEHQSVGEVTQ